MQHSQPETPPGARQTCEHLSINKPLEAMSAKRPGADPSTTSPRRTATTLLKEGHRS